MTSYNFKKMKEKQPEIYHLFMLSRKYSIYHCPTCKEPFAFRLLEKRICPQCEGTGLIGDEYSGDLSLPHPDIEEIVKKRETINNYQRRYPKIP